MKEKLDKIKAVLCEGCPDKKMNGIHYRRYKEILQKANEAEAQGKKEVAEALRWVIISRKDV